MNKHTSHTTILRGLRLAALASACAGFSAIAAPAALPPGISGSWFNPEQPGHGFSFEVFEDERALAYWYVFDREGRPVHLYIDGRIDGTRILGEAYLGRGMRFGEFDPADHQLARWGSVELDFADCRSAALSWDPDGPAGGPDFQAGSLELQQLVRISGLPCSVDDPEFLPVGLLDGRDQARAYSDREYIGDALAAVDPQGRLWSVDVSLQLDNTGIGWLPYGLVTTGELDFAAPGLASFEIEVRANAGWTDLQCGQRCDLRLPLATTPMQLNMTGSPVVGFAGIASGGGERGAELRFNPADSSRTLQAPADPDSVAGNYGFPGRGQLLSYTVGASVETDGSICINVAASSSPCAIAGTLSPAAGAAGEAGFFDVVLRSQVEPDIEYHGRGWRETGASPALVIVTTRGDLGMGFVLQDANWTRARHPPAFCRRAPFGPLYYPRRLPHGFLWCVARPGCG